MIRNFNILKPTISLFFYMVGFLKFKVYMVRVLFLMGVIYVNKGRYLININTYLNFSFCKIKKNI